MLTAALFVICGDLYPNLDFGQVKTNYEVLHPMPIQADGW